MAPGTPGPSGAKAPLEPFPVPQRTLDLRREDVYLRIALCVHEPASTNPSARRGRPSPFLGVSQKSAMKNECATQSYDPTERVGGFYTSTLLLSV